MTFAAAMALTPKADADSTPSVPARYSIVDLGTLGGGFTFGIGVNNSGQATGLGATATGDVHAFIWQNGQMADAGTLGGSFSEALLINSRGQAVGDSTTAAGENHLALFELQGGQVRATDLGILPGASAMFGQGINDGGQVVGEADFANGVAHTVLADGTGIHDLHSRVSLGGASDTAYVITDSGKILGESDLTGGLDSHAFLLDGSGLHDLGSLVGTWSEAFAINASGQISGESGRDPHQHAAYKNFQAGVVVSTPGLHNRAFLYSGGVMHALDPLPDFTESAGPWLDGQGNVFGTSSNARRTKFAATMWVQGNPTSINTLLVNAPTNLAVVQEVVWGNDLGQLMAYGLTTGGQTHAYLLTPVTGSNRQ